MSEHPTNDLTVTLTADEALVLFEFLRRFSDTDQLLIEDTVEQRALWNLCCVFEKRLSVPLECSYAELLKAARDRLRDE